jgi:hypothetical protein
MDVLLQAAEKDIEEWHSLTTQVPYSLTHLTLLTHSPNLIHSLTHYAAH